MKKTVLTLAIDTDAANQLKAYLPDGSSVNLPGAGAAFIPPTGTGFVTVTGGNLDVAASVFPLPVARGGTGLTAPGASGNLLTSNGSAWVSAAPGSSGTSVTGTGLWHSVAGALQGAASLLVNADVAAAAAIAGTKVAPNFGAQDVQTSGGMLATYHATGGAIATAGAFRLPASAGCIIGIRDLGNAQNLNALYTNVDRLYVGGDSTFSSAVQVTQLHLFAQSYQQRGLGGATYETLDTGAIHTFVPTRVGRPVTGETTLSSPWGSDGDVGIALAGVDKTLVAAEYSQKIWRFTGTLGGGEGGNRIMTIPSVVTGEGYTKEVWVDIATDSAVILSTGVGKQCKVYGTGTSLAINRVTISVTTNGVVAHGCVTNADASAISN